MNYLINIYVTNLLWQSFQSWKFGTIYQANIAYATFERHLHKHTESAKRQQTGRGWAETVRVTEIISDTFQCRRQFRQINFVFFCPCHDGSMRAYRLRFNWVWFIGIFRLTTTTIQYVRIECVMFMSVDDLNIRWLQWLEWSCNKSNYRYISYVV